MPDPSVDDVTSELGVKGTSPSPDSEPLGQLEQLEKEGRWEELIASLIEGAATAGTVGERLRCYLRAAAVYENQLQDAEKAYITLQAAFGEDYSNEEVARELERRGRRPGPLEGADRRLRGDAARGGGRRPEGRPVPGPGALASEPGGYRGGRGQAGQGDPGRSRFAGGGARPIGAADAGRGLEEAGRAPDPIGDDAAPQADRVALLLEAAQLYHRKLSDAQTAAGLYGQVLELEPDSSLRPGGPGARSPGTTRTG